MNNNDKIQEIIKQFDMKEHPEGGFYSETYKSIQKVEGVDRVLMTVIYFLLPSHHVSKFHRIKSDEFWFFHSGSPLVVHSLTDKGHLEVVLGNDLANGELPQYLVPKETVFGSSVLQDNSYSLVSCVVSPGFEFADFELFTKEQLCELFPGNSRVIDMLT